MKRCVLIVGMLLVAAAGLGAWVLLKASLSALPKPGRLETSAATRAKRFVVGRSARNSAPQPPTNLAVLSSVGGMQFRGSCANCHGLDGRTASDLGRGMYPRASDLGSPEVQQWSDGELFWIIKNGIRFTGMPGFGKTMADGEIWPLVAYLRSLAAKSEGQAEAGLLTEPATQRMPHR